LITISNAKFSSALRPIKEHVKNTSKVVDCSGSALLIIKNDEVVLEEYWGKHSKDRDARKIQGNTQFHIASVRKSYIGFTVAYAVYKGYIESIDDLVTKYHSTSEPQLFKDTTLRHLLTHTHGLKYSEGKIQREFFPGESWEYRGIGIDTLTKIVENVTGKTVAEILTEQVFNKLNFQETGWYAEMNKNLVEVIREPNDSSWYNGKSTAGDERNMYVSARELAKWGSLHLKKGFMDGNQIIPSEIINLVASLQSPESINDNLPQNGFLWFVKDLPAKKSEIGELVPKGAFQILGYTGVTLLVIPQHNVVAVRAFNSFGSPDGYDYLADVRSFGDTIIQCL